LAGLPALLATSALHAAYTQVLYTPAAGDAQYSWNSRYAGEGYDGVGALTVGVATSFYSGIPSDTQYTAGILMVPIASLRGGERFSRS
jgi:ABC-type uncharacterized transport system permease subunit